MARRAARSASRTHRAGPRARPAEPAAVLRAVRRRNPDGSPVPMAGPLIPLLDTTLLTHASGEPTLWSQLQSEIESADAIDVVVAFIRRSGIRPLLDSLRRHCEAGSSARGCSLRPIRTRPSDRQSISSSTSVPTFASPTTRPRHAIQSSGRSRGDDALAATACGPRSWQPTAAAAAAPWSRRPAASCPANRGRLIGLVENRPHAVTFGDQITGAPRVERHLGDAVEGEDRSAMSPVQRLGGENLDRVLRRLGGPDVRSVL